MDRLRTLGSMGVLTAASVVGMLLAFAQKLPCRSGAWNSYPGQFQHVCYTDIYPLYGNEGLSSGQVPYLGHPVEYPVLTGWAMQVAAWLVHGVDVTIRGRAFFDVTVLLLAVFFVIGVLAAATAAGPDFRWTALLVALSPALILGAFINWDLIAMALGMLGIAAWSKRRCELAGVFLGLAVAAKFYPIVLLGPLLLLCIRTGQLRAFGRTVLAGAAAWLAVNLPVMIVAWQGWSWFYVFSKQRGADWGSIWFYFEHMNLPLLGDNSTPMLNLMSGVFLALFCAGIAWLALAAPRRPRLPQLCFLVLAAFLITNKVWSPQYVVWLVPLAVLARPRLWTYAIWQVAEICYFVAIWGYLIFVYQQAKAPGYTPFTGYQGLSSGWYFAMVLFRLITVLVLAGFIVADILVPDRDVVRASGLDDPAGGIFDQAPDTFALSHLTSAAKPGVSQTTGAPAP